MNVVRDEFVQRCEMILISGANSDTLVIYPVMSWKYFSTKMVFCFLNGDIEIRENKVVAIGMIRDAGNDFHQCNELCNKLFLAKDFQIGIFFFNPLFSDEVL